MQKRVSLLGPGKILQQEYLVAEVGFDTAKNGHDFGLSTANPRYPFLFLNRSKKHRCQLLRERAADHELDRVGDLLVLLLQLEETLLRPK